MLRCKRDGFTVEDLRAVARLAGLKRGRAQAILAEVGEAVAGWRTIADEVGEAVAGWRTIADEVGVDERMAEQIERSHRLGLPAG